MLHCLRGVPLHTRCGLVGADGAPDVVRAPRGWCAQLPRPRTLWRIGTIGAPVAASGALASWASWSLGRTLAALSPRTLAAYGIGRRIEATAHTACHGFRVGVATVVGQCAGARAPERARRATTEAAKAAMSMGAFANFARLHHSAGQPLALSGASGDASPEVDPQLDALASQFAHFMQLDEGEPDAAKIESFKHQFTDFMHWTHGGSAAYAPKNAAELETRQRFAKLSAKFLHAHHPELASQAGVPGGHLEA